MDGTSFVGLGKNKKHQSVFSESLLYCNLYYIFFLVTPTVLD